jgi:hypothetical protein
MEPFITTGVRTSNPTVTTFVHVRKCVAEIRQPGYPFLIQEIMGQVTFLIIYKKPNFLSEFV